MTTPRDDIAGLSERLRFDAARCELHFSKGVASNIEEAADVIDALQARVKELEGDLDYATEVIVDKRRLTREIDIALHGKEGAAEQASLCDLVEPARQLKARALRAEQERDEAYERLKPFTAYTVKAITVSEEFDYCVHVCCSSDEQPQFKHFRDARDLVRRLAAGPEKIAVANDGEERK